MTEQHETLANKVVTSFKDVLTEDIRSSIGDSNFEALKGMVCEALSEHSLIIASRFDDVIKELKSEVCRPSLEL
jgi:hypothetical protein